LFVGFSRNRRIFTHREPVCALPALKRMALEKERHQILLRFLDELAFQADPDVAARVLSSISEFLVMAALHQKEFLRSGPASNVQWQEAYEHLTHERQHEGIRLLSAEREKWMSRSAIQFFFRLSMLLFCEPSVLFYSLSLVRET
jgi:hypothetical protein